MKGEDVTDGHKFTGVGEKMKSKEFQTDAIHFFFSDVEGICYAESKGGEDEAEV